MNADPLVTFFDDITDYLGDDVTPRLAGEEAFVSASRAHARLGEVLRKAQHLRNQPSGKAVSPTRL